MCDGSETDHVMVDNPKRARLVYARDSLADAFADLKTALTDADSAMTAGAWTGTKARQFEPELSGRGSTLRSAASNARATFTEAINALPREVRKCELNPWDVPALPFLPPYGVP